MKKNLFLGLIALTALTVTGCSKDDVVSESPNINRAIEFGTYVGRDAQSRASVLDNTTEATSLSKQGFGVFAYYTDDAHYNGTAGSGSMLNFMNNTKVTSDDATTWKYSPIKYWPNETNDRLTFFAYAPYDDADTDKSNNIPNTHDNISFNVVQGDPIIDFAVNGTVKYQQDLVWSRTNNKDIIKNPNVDVDDKVTFNFAHALSRIGFTVKAITDEVTAVVPNKLDDNTFIVLKKVMLSSVAGVGNSEPTTGVFYTNGKLNLNNQSTAITAAPALWTECTGAQTFTLADANFVEQNVTYPLGISYTENGFVLTENTSIINTIAGNSTMENQLNAADSFIMVIPQNLSSAGFYVYVEYDVVTIDESLTNKLSVVTNHISKKVDGLNFESGKAYTLNLQLGMTSVKVTASVDNWNDVSGTNVDLPINTPEP